MSKAVGTTESPGRRGRPRSSDPRRPGATAAEEILDAAAELFSRNGYATTSTRRIAEAVGIRQASLYHHFPTKDHILTALLDATVQAPLALARELAQSDLEPLDRLITLATFDASFLASATFNLGALYHLPELAHDEFTQFRSARAELGGLYQQFAGDAIGDPHDTRALLPFRLVESIIGLRSDGELDSGRSDGRQDVVRTIVNTIKLVVTVNAPEPATPVARPVPDPGSAG